MKRLSTLKDLEISRSAPDSNDLEEPLSITGLETFSLNYKVCLLISLVVEGNYTAAPHNKKKKKKDERTENCIKAVLYVFYINHRFRTHVR